ncbi:MAG TPA: cytochrome P450 [Baekduia sp.]|uniref:cytochrome P450 n=1 Tax=Baekduia sp. TaxID=2600305 RepID=UPI002D797B94|nr:cytochrome P450 [Baekduia sp.]HET6509083.1 cytochrome P450 [Baekduia sp.]
MAATDHVEAYDRALEDFDITHPLWSEDFHGLQDHIRSRCPVLHSRHQSGYYVLTKHDDIMSVLRDHETYSSEGGVFLTPLPGNQRLIPTDVDPPLQREFRRLIDGYLSAARVAPLEPEIRRTADELIDAFIDRGTCELYGEFAQPLPNQVFLRLILDVRGDDEVEANHHVEAAMSSETLEEVEAGFDALKQWCSDLIRRREAAERRDDLIDGLIRGRVFDRAMTHDEQVSALMSVTIGGLETASSVIGYGTVLLVENPEIQARVRADPSLLPTAVEEIIRLASPTALMRTVTRDARLSDQDLRAGDRVLIVFPAANRDPDAFPEPNRFSLDRPNAKEAVSFGAGMHRCLGSNLARMTLRTAFGRLIERLDDLALTAPVEFTATQIRSPRAVRLSFTKRAGASS